MATLLPPDIVEVNYYSSSFKNWAEGICPIKDVSLGRSVPIHKGRV